jgi:aminoglycoside/choline kinase family phosphotransferase
MGALVGLQACGPEASALPSFSRSLLMQEMELFRDWFLGRELGLALNDAERGMLTETFEHLADSALGQPQVCVHRDYHSRNLLVAEHNPGVLDFQDAVIGPVTYDLVSLLRDCYVAWPKERVEEWAIGYHNLAVQSGILREEDERGFLAWFDLMGVQRHLKAIGIFSRLQHRDGKSGYLNDIPRTLEYVREVSGRYPELSGLHTFVEDRVLPYRCPE